MHTETHLKQITSEITSDIHAALGSKLHKIILYGSYARGDFNEDSDIDIMVLADIDEENIRNFNSTVDSVANKVSLEYDALVTISLRNRRLFFERLKILPFYQNVMKDGVELYGN